VVVWQHFYSQLVAALAPSVGSRLHRPRGPDRGQNTPIRGPQGLPGFADPPVSDLPEVAKLPRPVVPWFPSRWVELEAGSMF